MNDRNTELQTLREKISAFQAERGWLEWHNARSLAISVTLEAAELLEIFQWTDNAGADRLARETEREHFREELADVLIYCLSLANAYDVDVTQAILEKLDKNAVKYPAKKREE